MSALKLSPFFEELSLRVWVAKVAADEAALIALAQEAVAAHTALARAWHGGVLQSRLFDAFEMGFVVLLKAREAGISVRPTI